jgi:hypothetical protein
MLKEEVLMYSRTGAVVSCRLLVAVVVYKSGQLQSNTIRAYINDK